jgi:hypothetical protein
MYRVVGGVLVLLLAIPALWAEDKPREKEKDAPASPAEQYRALLQEYHKASNAYFAALQAAKTPQERSKLNSEKNPRVTLAPKFLALAEKYPKDPVAVDALVWVVSGSAGPAGGKPRARAIELLSRDHVQSEKLTRVCQSLGYGVDKPGETLLRAVLEKNKSAEVRAEACLALAQRLQRQAGVLQRIEGNAEMARAFENSYGKETVAELKKKGRAGLEGESETFFKRLADKHLADLKPDRLKSVCQTLAFNPGKGSEVFLRALLEKDSRRDIQGAACLSLAQVLKQSADETADGDPRTAAKLRADSEKLFERADDKYADVKFGFRGTVGDQAKKELFDLRFLAVGKKAPEVEGEDQDGKKFKLGDYKGKVVLLDFWSQF